MQPKRTTRKETTPEDERVDAVTSTEAEKEDPFAVIDRMRAAFADVPDEEIVAETDRILAGVREEMRAERERAAGVAG